MSEDLLAREKEFHRLNRELGRKTKDLMREVDSVLISRSTNFVPRCGNEISVSYDYCPTLFSHEKITKRTDDDAVTSTKACNDGNVELENLTVEEIVSKDVESSKKDGFVRFLKAKMKLLHDELEINRVEYKKKCNYCKELETNNKKLEETKTKLQNNVTSLKETIGKFEGNISNLQTVILARGTENAALKKEIDSLKKDLKTANQQSSNLDVRLNRSSEENEKLRNVVKFHKIEEKELREQMRKLQDQERLLVNRLARQRSEILQAFKKQTSLVDNLKRQNAYLVASKQVQLTNEEFSRLLDWTPENT